VTSRVFCGQSSDSFHPRLRG